jgi:hypothetical protein
MKRSLVAIFIALLALPLRGLSFDHSHAAWTALLAKHVLWVDGGYASQVRYAAFQENRKELKAYLASLSAVSRQNSMAGRRQQLAFHQCSNASRSKILTRYPNLKSIRDFDSSSATRGRTSLYPARPDDADGIEHDTIRKPGAYDDPRIHMRSIALPLAARRCVTRRMCQSGSTLS